MWNLLGLIISTKDEQLCWKITPKMHFSYKPPITEFKILLCAPLTMSWSWRLQFVETWWNIQLLKSVHVLILDPFYINSVTMATGFVPNCNNEFITTSYEFATALIHTSDWLLLHSRETIVLINIEEITERRLWSLNRWRSAVFAAAL